MQDISLMKARSIILTYIKLLKNIIVGELNRMDLHMNTDPEK